MFKKKWFTLLEIVVAILGFSLLMMIVFGIFQKFITLKYNAQARGNLIEVSYFTFEKLNLLIKDYTIDYEEYFNRRNVWCDSWYQNNFTWNVGANWYCDNFTAYGNNTTLGSTTGNFLLYYCSSTGTETTPNYVFQNLNLANWSGCNRTGYQSFGEYKQQFWDMKDDVDFVTGIVYDDDDSDIGKWPNAILNASGTQELYLISQDQTRRIFLRRAFIESWDFNGTWWISGDTEKFYTLQILKLRWFDAGNKHKFDVTTSSGVYDGTLDTRACDYAQWFACQGSGVGGAYSWFNIPKDKDDGRINLFDKNITIADWNLKVYPTKNPSYARAEDNMQINPYFIISMTSKLYWWVRFKKLRLPSIEDFQLSLQTTFNTKNFYTK